MWATVMHLTPLIMPDRTEKCFDCRKRGNNKVRIVEQANHEVSPDTECITKMFLGNILIPFFVKNGGWW